MNENIKKGGQRANAPNSIQIPQGGWPDNGVTTPRANGASYPMTPGMGIGVATPALVGHLPGVPEDGSTLDKRVSQASRTSVEKTGDYFSRTPIATDANTNANANAKPVASPQESQPDEKVPKSPADGDKESNGKDSSTLFGKKCRRGM